MRRHQHARSGRASPYLVLGQRVAAGFLSRAGGENSSSSRLARRNASDRGPGKAHGVANLGGEGGNPRVMPFPGALQPASAFRELPAGGAQCTSLNCSIYQSLNLSPAFPHVAAPVLVMNQ